MPRHASRDSVHPTTCRLLGRLLATVFGALSALEGAHGQATIDAPRAVVLDGRTFHIPSGMELVRAADRSLVERPISADYDHLGRLYVSESSGANDRVQVQLEQLPHRILRLIDVDGDGRFDQRTVFADKMMFPEGVLWRKGSLYVAAPPQIWKLTDSDNDGVADQREVWFDGQTLTGCANDLHGPYLGRDGWIYWCKGAFAEQHYALNGRPWATRAAHIFRRRPEGGPIEPVMTGGMDNPVELVFTPEGERIFNTTFLQHPAGGRRDGLIHAIYGGVYGKEHGVLSGHPRTGPLMPVLQHLGPAAPSGLAWLESDYFGESQRGAVLTSCFNLHKITSTTLTPRGATFEATTHDFLSSDDLDFHPTDVLENPDGSLLIVDTGGWYKLCCPTSQLHKPDILGGLYRLQQEKPTAAAEETDFLGAALNWTNPEPAELALRLGDSRPAVRRRTLEQIAGSQDQKTQVRELLRVLQHHGGPMAAHRRDVVWALTRIATSSAREALRFALQDDDDGVVQAAVHSLSVLRDRDSRAAIERLLARRKAPHLQRVAAEAIGRLGDSQSIPALLQALQSSELDRVLQHSLTYALIELADADGLRRGLASPSAQVRQAAFIALDQASSELLERDDVLSALDDEDESVREIAWSALQRREAWRGAFLERLREAWRAADTESALRKVQARTAASLDLPACQQMLTSLLQPDAGNPAPLKVATTIAEMVAATGPALEDSPLLPTITQQISDARLRGPWLRALESSTKLRPAADLAATLERLAAQETAPAEQRLQALLVLSRGDHLVLDEATFAFLTGQLEPRQTVRIRTLAADALQLAKLSTPQLELLLQQVAKAGPLELSALVGLYRNVRQAELAHSFLAALSRNNVVASLDQRLLNETLTALPKESRSRAEALQNSIVQANQAQWGKLESVLPLEGDPRNGQRIFQSERAACSACHKLGYVGGEVGPDLRRIGAIRSDRDLLESILFPSASLVRSFEPETLQLSDGRVFSGVCRDQGDFVLVYLDANKTVRVAQRDIESRQPSPVSIMPAGLDKLLSDQELADLVAFLKSAN